MKFVHKLVFICFCCLALIASLFNQTIPVQADDLNHAYIIVRYGENNQVIREISFSGSITGKEGLELAGFTVTMSGSGYMCGIDDYIDCDTYAHYWNTNYWSADQWVEYSVGVTQSTLTDGSVDGYSWVSYPDPHNLPPATAMIAGYQALEWLQTQQTEDDGGYVSMGDTAEVLLATSANQVSPSDWKVTDSTPSMMNYIMLNGADYSQNSVSAAAKLSIGINASDGCYPYGGAFPSDYYDDSTSLYDTGAGPDSWAILGALADDESIPASAVTALMNMVDSSGGWAWDSSSAYTSDPDTNTTALAIQALIATGIDPSDSIITNALAYLKSAQNDDGGFPYDPNSSYGTDSDVDSTAYVLQALLAAGESPTGSAWESSSSNTPLSYLLSVQLSDGSFPYQTGDSNIMATRQAIPALLYHYYPLASNYVSACSSFYTPIITRD